MKRIISGVIALTLLVSLGLAGASCVPIVQAKTGTIEVRVTDAPGNVTAIEVTVSEVEVHKEVAGEGEWTPLTITGPNPFDLIKIRDKEQLLVTGDVDTARYTQIRMTVDMVEVTYLEDGVPTTVEATLPSGKLKFVRPFDVVAGGTTTLIIDFDADKSVVFAGADKVIFKPVVKLSIEHEVALALTVTTSAATDIATTSATLNGSLDDLGSFTSVDVSFEYGTTSGALDNETSPEEMSETGTFSVALNELSLNSTYYFKAKAEGDGTISYGDELSFATLPVAPTATTSAATDIATTSATLNGSLDDLGSFTSVDVSFEYGTTSGALDNETSPEEMSETGTFSVALNELSLNSTYYFKAKAEGDGTISYGDELSFTTPS